MKTVFIASPFRGATLWVIEQNVRQAENIGLQVAFSGMVPLIPQTMYRFFQDSLSDEFWLKATTELLSRCDAILLCEGWEYSDGCKGERQFAEEHKIPAFLNIEDLRRWHRDDKLLATSNDQKDELFQRASSLLLDLEDAGDDFSCPGCGQGKPLVDHRPDCVLANLYNAIQLHLERDDWMLVQDEREQASNDPP